MLYCHKYFYWHFLSIFYKKQSQIHRRRPWEGSNKSRVTVHSSPELHTQQINDKMRFVQLRRQTGCRDRVSEISQYLKQLIDLLTIFKKSKSFYYGG